MTLASGSVGAWFVIIGLGLVAPRTVPAQGGHPGLWVLAAAHAGLGQTAFEWRFTWWEQGRFAPLVGGTIGTYDPQSLLGDQAAELGFSPPSQNRTGSNLWIGATRSVVECRNGRVICLSAIGMAGLTYLKGQPAALTGSGEIASVATRVAPRLDLGLALHLLRGPVRLNVEGRVAALYYSGVGTRVGPVLSAGASFWP